MKGAILIKFCDELMKEARFKSAAVCVCVCRETAGTPPTTRWVPGKRAAAKKEYIATGPSPTVWTKTSQVSVGVSHRWTVVPPNPQPPS